IRRHTRSKRDWSSDVCSSDLFDYMSGMDFANSPVVWIFASAIVALVIFQAVKFLSLSKKAARDVGISETDIKRAVKTGSITAIEIGRASCRERVRRSVYGRVL